MAPAMIATAGRSLHPTRIASCALLACALSAPTAIFSAGALAASAKSHTNSPLGLPIPASARVHGTTTTPATPAPATGGTPASTTPTSSTPTPTTPATTTPASGAQPGTVAPTTTPGSTTPTTSVPATGTPNPSTTRSGAAVGVARKASPSNTHMSTGALALAVLGALLALACIVWALARWLALEPRWTVSLMHSLREASYRGSATWAEFTDWTRLGR
jgi:hypothetical protein